MKDLLIYLRRFLIFSIPFLLIVITYLICDPFMVLYRYDDYNKKIFIPRNRDFISSEMYLRNHEKYNYDSYIFGSSTALFVKPSIWQEYLDSSNLIFSFDASRENFVGIWSKLKFIDMQNQPINNALIVIDVDYPFKECENDNVLFVNHYKIIGSSWFEFQYMNFIKTLDFNFIRSVISYSLTKEFKPYMTSSLIKEISYIDLVTNEFQSITTSDEFRNDSLNYYEIRKDRFPGRTGQFKEQVSMVTAEHIRILNEMKEILTRNNTDYKIIISPNYAQIAFNRADRDLLYTIFGKENVFDFSGINSFSEDMSNFYDGLHFKPYVGKEFLDIAYSSKSLSGYNLND